MSRNVWFGLLLFVGISLIGAWVLTPKNADGAVINAGFADEANALAFIALIALGIERILEVFWGFVGTSAGGWWPLTLVTSAISDAEEQANEVMNPFINGIDNTLGQLKAAMRTAGKAADQVDAVVGALKVEADRIASQMAAAEKLAKGSERLALVSSVVADGNNLVAAIEKQAKGVTGTIRGTLGAANNAVTTANSVVEAFSDNPARRTMSILIGVSFGLLVAGFMGLNLFAAILEDEAEVLAGIVGVFLTGVVMGLGSSPTHEVVKAVQQFKESRKLPTVSQAGIGARQSRQPEAQSRLMHETADGPPPPAEGEQRVVKPQPVEKAPEFELVTRSVRLRSTQ